MYYPARAVIDLDAIRANVSALAHHAAPAQVMAVVKADAYGHGLLPCARAALAGGASWLGVAQLGEALELRRALRGATAGEDGDGPVDAAFFPTAESPDEPGLLMPPHPAPEPHILSWLHGPGAPYAEAIAQDVDLSVSDVSTLIEIAQAARESGRMARLHLKVDTGLGRGGAAADDWLQLVRATRAAQAEGAVELIGIWSHLAFADEIGHPVITAQRDAFEAANQIAEREGLRPLMRHLANSAATLSRPDLHFDLVRPGISCYGLAPGPACPPPPDVPLRPAMRLEAELILVKRVPAGHGVSYGHDYRTAHATTLAVVPLGYGDGIPRHASGRAPVQVHAERHLVAGRVCMDQFVLDLGPRSTARIGDTVVLFGDPADGVPGADDWAEAAGTINYEIVTRLGPRVPHVFVGGRQ